MHPEVGPAAQIFQLNTGLVPMLLDGISAADSEVWIQKKGNSLQWITGHLCSSRFYLLSLLDGQMENPFGELFARGAKTNPGAAYPPLAEILSVWSDVAEQLLTRLGELTAEELSVASPAKFPLQDKTALGAVTFLAFHEGYHVGQLGYIRNLLGYASPIG